MDFPINILPEKAQSAIRAQQAMGNYRIEAVGSAALAIMSLAVQAHFDVEDPAQYEKFYPTSQYFMVLMDSGDAKSSVYKKLMIGHDNWQETAIEEYERKMLVYNIDLEDYEQKVKDTKKMGPVTRTQVAQEAPVKPRNPRNLSSKATVNGLFKNLDKDWPSYGLFSDEAGSVLAGHSFRAENSPAEFASTLTSLWDAGRADRTTAEISQYLVGKRLSALLMVQPVVANEFLQNKILAEQGIHARIHMVRSPKWEPIKVDFSNPSEIARRQALAVKVGEFNTRINKLLSLPLPELKDGVLSPNRIGWSAEARTRAVAINHECMDARLTHTEAYWQRLWEHVCRMAGVLTAFEGHREVTLPVLEAAWAIVQFYANEWASLDIEVGTQSDRRLEPFKAKVLKFMSNKPNGQTARDLTRNPLRTVDGSIRDRVLKELVADEYLKVERVQSGTRQVELFKLVA